MFWAIFLTLLISTLIFVAYEFRAQLLNSRKENKRLRQSNQYLSNKLEECRNFEVERRVKDSYHRGLYDGRETDMAYREVLKRCKDGNYDAEAYAYLQREKAGVPK